ncbi:DUF6489 family protein [Yunchengibacter salinarum]|uniref:DUF6489 family protein n=1 Tax=Yunchengibacter salinarum TaxID=3133399 RepID=UPI0035B61A1D
MKVSIDIDCTPEEARTFFGLPDLTPVHDTLVREMQRRMEEGISPEEIDRMMAGWMGGATSGFGEMQKAFWSMMEKAGQSGKKGS